MFLQFGRGRSTLSVHTHFLKSRPKARLALIRATAASVSAIEPLEQRRLLTAYTVTNTSDSGSGSLRQAILNSNADVAQSNTINFNIPTTDPNFSGGLYTITPATSLPSISSPVTVDGTSQPGHGTTPVIVIDGTTESIGTLSSGLAITSGGTTIEGLEITHFSNAAIVLNGATQTTIGGLTVGSGNVLSGNRSSSTGLSGGILIISSYETAIEGNYIGTDPTGLSALPNDDGIEVGDDSNETTIGGTTAAARNVISGNSDNILLTGIDALTDDDTVGGSNVIEVTTSA